MNDFSNKDFEKLDPIVKRYLNKNNQESILYFTKIIKHWEVIIGTPLFTKTLPLKMEGKKLYILVDNSAYAHHLKYFETRIIELINSPAICGENSVRQIIFRVGPLSEQKQALRDNQLTPPRMPLDEKTKEIIHTISEQIHDPRLKKSFSRFMDKNLTKRKPDHET